MGFPLYTSRINKAEGLSSMFGVALLALQHS